MKNRTESGIHFDEATSKDYRPYVFRFLLGGKENYLELLIPKRIMSSLNSADFDEIESYIPEWCNQIAQGMVEMVNQRKLSAFEMAKQMEPVLKIKVGSEIYQKFIIHQSKVGNERWQVPPTLSEISAPPEEDQRYNDGEGRLRVQ